MFGLSRKERLAASLKDGEAALVASRFDDAHTAFVNAAKLAEDLDARDAQGRALLAAAKAALAQGDGDRASYLAAEAVVTLELAGAASTTAFDVLSASTSAPIALTVERALDVARKHARNDDHDALLRTGDVVLLRILKGAPADVVVSAGLELCMQAIVVERADLCARWMFAMSGALRALCMTGAIDDVRRASDLLAAAISRANVEPIESEEGVSPGVDEWAFALADLLVELSDRALEPLRITRAHIVRARVLLDADRPADARTSARAAFALSRVLGLGDDDPLGAEAAQLLAAANERAPTASA